MYMGLATIKVGLLVQIIIFLCLSIFFLNLCGVGECCSSLGLYFFLEIILPLFNLQKTINHVKEVFFKSVDFYITCLFVPFKASL